MYLLGIHDKNLILHPITCNNTDKNVKEMKTKLINYPKCLENLNHNEVPPILDAAILGHDKCIKFLIESGANLHASCPMGDLLTVCILSGHSNHIKCVEYLISNNIFPLNNTTLNRYILPACIYHNDKPIIIDLLFKFGATIDDYKKEELELKTYTLNSPTVTAIKLGDAKLLCKLLLHGGIVDYKQSGKEDLTDEQKDCLSLIHHASVRSITKQVLTFKDVLYVLHEFGSNFLEKNRLGLNPLQIRENVDSIKTELEVRQIQYGNLDINELLNSEITKEINNKMSKLQETPLSLQSLCRLHLYHTHRVDYLNFVNKISYLIPDQVVNILQFNDVIDKCVISGQKFTRMQSRLEMFVQ